MHFRSKWTIALAAIVVFIVGCGPQQTIHPRDTDLIFQQAWKLEDSGRRQEALDELKRVAADQASKPEAAAKALYQAGLYASERMFKSDDERLKDQKEGAALWAELADKYPNTEAAKEILDDHTDAPQGRLVALYQTIAREETRNEEAAADALYQAGLFASEKFRGSSPDKKNEAELAAAQVWKQVSQDYSTTTAGRLVNGATADAPNGRLVALETRIDKRNQADWKYQLLSVLVKATGSVPSFSYAFALIILAIIVKILTFPLTKKQYSGMKDMQKLQPMVKELQKKYKGTELHEKTMALYKEHNVNPLGGCLPMLVQMPFLIFLFSAIRTYEFAFAHGTFLWIGTSLADKGVKFMGHNVFAHNLSEPDIVLLALYAITMYITTRLTPATDPQQQQQQKTMALVMSSVFFMMFLNYRWSSAFVLYWFVQNLLSIWQQYTYIYKPHLATQAAGTAPPTVPPADSNGVGKNGSGAPPTEATPITKPDQPARVKPRRKKK